VVAGNVRVNDPTTSLIAGLGATQVDANTVDVPLASITGTGISITTQDGADVVTLDATLSAYTRALSIDGGLGVDDVILMRRSRWAPMR
jgi:hypothetical protein